MSTSTLLADLLAFFSSDRVSTATAILEQNAQDESSFPARPPDVVVWPTSTTEVSQVLAYAHQHQVPVTARGAGTSLEGQPIPLQGGIVLNFQQMNQIVAIYAEDFQARVQPGIFYKDMNRTLAGHGLFFAPDPGANASIGGMLANNAAGIRTVKYGATRDNVLALEVVLASGEIIHTGSRAVKQSSGYDLTHLFVGSEGTLGLITEATLKLAPLPEQFSAATAAFPSVAAAAQTVFDIMGSGLGPAALELLDELAVTVLNTDEGIHLSVAPHLFMEFTGPSESALQQTLATVQEICRENGGNDFRSGTGRDQRNTLWDARHRLFEIHKRYFPGQKYLIADVAVPISHFPAVVSRASQLIAELQLAASIISHAGDGNVHLTIFYPPADSQAQARAQQLNEAIVNYALELDGTSTGEHGVGIGKQKFMLPEHGPGAVALMRQLKALLDPQGILNPGKVLPLT
ncbi:MAG: FAD-binding protein [Chloroflexi bacterium]|nr:FAD-binding protein [Chloroflexota bacterium]MCI0581084.1 FAD-binding protein [Chloroflexota bacterium]MCI0645815.1 FAD-binding protein [Chloroflexota bacterium]MCI0727738.1 FAD-binding protein [Chloroflexota bacterium]